MSWKIMGVETPIFIHDGIWKTGRIMIIITTSLFSLTGNHGFYREIIAKWPWKSGHLTQVYFASGLEDSREVGGRKIQVSAIL